MRKNPFKEVETTLGYRFRKKSLLEAALTHPSFIHEVKEAPISSNQRLEFLGDAVLDLVIAEDLYARIPTADEGTLTRLRSQVCNGKSLAVIGRQWNLGGHLRLGKGEIKSGGAERESNLTDAVEAILGAIYLDGGIKAAQKIIRRFFDGMLVHLIQETPEQNPKGGLQEWAQAVHKESPVYVILGEEGPSHDRHYRAEVRVAGQALAEGSGSSKRRAEVEAAREALRLIQSKS